MAVCTGEGFETQVDELVVSEILFAGEATITIHALKLPDHKVRNIDVPVQVVLGWVGFQALGIEARIH